MNRQGILAVCVLSVSFLGACTDSDNDSATSSLAQDIAFDDILQPLRQRLHRSRTSFFDATIWATDQGGQLHVSRSHGDEWDSVTLPGEGRITAMQFEQGGKLGLVVNEHGISMRTSDGGETWTATDLKAQVAENIDPEWGGSFEHFSFDATLEQGTWVDYCELFQTTDSGATWQHLTESLVSKKHEGYCVEEASYNAAAGSWFAAVDVYGRVLKSGNYLFRSDDGGATWRELCSLDEVGLLLESVPSCFKPEQSDKAMLSAILGFNQDLNPGDMKALEAFYEKIDHGVFVANSLEIPAELRGMYAQAHLFEDQQSDRIWLNERERLAYTDDGGKQWQVVAHALPENESLDFSLGMDRAVAVYDYKYLAMSGDLGKTWQSKASADRYIYDFEIIPEHNRIVVANDAGLALVDAQTFDWQPVPGVTQSSELLVAGSVIWSFAEDGEIHRSTDAGASWRRLPVNTEQEDFYVESASCSAEKCLLEGYQSVARLTAAPFSLEISDLNDALPDLEDNYIDEMLLDAQSDRGWVTLYDGDLYATDDGGRTWQRQARLREEVSSFSKAPDNSGFIVMGYENTYLWSGDGSTFERRQFPGGSEEGVSGLCWLGNSIALLTTYDEDQENGYAFFASTDGGASWGVTDPLFYDDNCLLKGDVVVFYEQLAKLK